MKNERDINIEKLEKIKADFIKKCNVIRIQEPIEYHLELQEFMIFVVNAFKEIYKQLAQKEDKWK